MQINECITIYISTPSGRRKNASELWKRGGGVKSSTSSGMSSEKYQVRRYGIGVFLGNCGMFIYIHSTLCTCLCACVFCVFAQEHRYGVAYFKVTAVYGICSHRAVCVQRVEMSYGAQVWHRLVWRWLRVLFVCQNVYEYTMTPIFVRWCMNLEPIHV